MLKNGINRGHNRGKPKEAVINRRHGAEDNNGILIEPGAEEAKTGENQSHNKNM